MLIYLRLATRNIIRHPIYSSINIFGLSISIACGLLGIIYIHYELGTDQFLTRRGPIYRMAMKYHTGKETKLTAPVEPGIASTLAQGFKQIKHLTRVLPTEGTIIGYEDENSFLSKDVFFADTNFFKVFPYEVLEGNLEKAFVNKTDIVLTEKIARKFFNSENLESAIGKKMQLRSTNKFQYNGEYVVKAILKDFPDNTHFQFQALIARNDEDFFVERSWAYTYFTLKQPISPMFIKKEWANYYDYYVKRYLFNNSGQRVFEPLIQDITQIYFQTGLSFDRVGIDLEMYPPGNVGYLFIFGGVALLIILVACINYVNMTTAHSAQRIKEVGLRKMLGAPRAYIILQFFLESFLLTFIAFFIAFSLVEVCLPYFSELMGKEIRLAIIFKFNYIFTIILFFGAVSLLAGIYPAFYLSNFKPLQALKVTPETSKYSLSFRKVLVVLQFSTTVITLAGTAVVLEQLYFLKKRDLGYQKDNILVVRLPKAAFDKLENIKKQLLTHQYIYKLGNSSETPGDDILPQFSFEIPVADTSKQIIMGRMVVGEGFLETMGIKLLEGEYFDESLGQKQIMLNEAAVKYLGWSKPIDKIFIDRDTAGKISQRRVVGIVKDFHFSSLHEAIQPMALILSNRLGNLFINIDNGNVDTVLAHLYKVWKDNLPTEPLNYFFLKENFDDHYATEESLAKLLTTFSILAIIISCLGLLGLALYLTELRTKEIAVRKILGASFQSLLILLSKDFIRLIFIASMVAIPPAYYIIIFWLENFAYHIELQWGIFLVAVGIAISTALIPLFSQGIVNARKAPIGALRDE